MTARSRSLTGHLRTHASVTPSGCRVLVYPARLGSVERQPAHDPLTALLGPGRAAALRALRVPASTAGLAEALVPIRSPPATPGCCARPG